MPVESKVLEGGKLVEFSLSETLNMKVCHEIGMALELLGSPRSECVLDLENVESLDSSGLAGLVKVRDEAKRVHKAIRIAKCPPLIKKKLLIPALADLFRADDHEADHTVLLIEDDRLTRGILRKAIERAFTGVRVEVASNGDQGLHVAREIKPDLVVLDWVMPEFDGPHFLHEQFKDASISRVPVIVHSVMDRKSISGVLCRFPAVRSFVYKVMPPSKLLETVRKALRISSPVV